MKNNWWRKLGTVEGISKNPIVVADAAKCAATALKNTQINAEVLNNNTAVLERAISTLSRNQKIYVFGWTVSSVCFALALYGAAAELEELKKAKTSDKNDDSIYETAVEEETENE